MPSGRAGHELLRAALHLDKGDPYHCEYQARLLAEALKPRPLTTG
jgi:hypothetical protein